MDFETFQNLPACEVARLVRAAGPKVCVFPINGTRRWFMLEHPPQNPDAMLAYFEIVGQRYVELFQLIFDHGLDTLLTPVFGSDLVDRGDDYLQMVTQGMARLATDRKFLDFYRKYQVRVRFYGDYRNYFVGTSYAYLLDQFDEITAQTLAYDQRRLFYGVCANDATETIGKLSVNYHAEHGRTPDRRTLVELYYGEHVPPVDIFIGFDKFCAFDMPLVAIGREDLYFTISPSPYLNKDQLRAMLYDHLYVRRAEEPDYSAMTPDDWGLMKRFYRSNQDKILGVGAKQKRGGYWYPLPQVEIPNGFDL